jgi:N-formylglutamate deformylase
VAKRFLADLSDCDAAGRRLDVRENVRFQGGYLSRWVNETFRGAGCALAIDVKKFFMDELTGELDREMFDAVGRALGATTAGVVEELGRC